MRWKRLLQGPVFLFAGGSVILFTYQSVRNFNRPAGNDLTVYLNASEEFYHNTNPYHDSERGFVYPLFLPTILYPLAKVTTTPVGKFLISGIWAALSFLAFFWTIKALSEPREPPAHLARDSTGPGERVLLFALMIIALHPFLQDEFLNGQVNLIAIGFVALYSVLLESEKQGPAAIALAIATAVKVAPVVFVMYALADKRYRLVAYYCVATLALIVGAPLLVSSHALSYYTYYLNTVTSALTAKEATFGYRSFSLLSTFTHTFSISIPAEFRLALTGTLALGLTLPVLLLFKRFDGRLSNHHRLIAFAIVASAIPLVFPMSESHHLLILMFPLLVVLQHWLSLLQSNESLLGESASRLLLLSFALLHLGQAFKPTPLRFLGLLGMYWGLVRLLRHAHISSDVSGIVAPRES